jgi:hexosaminidase
MPKRISRSFALIIAILVLAAACIRPQVVPLPAQGPEISIIPKPVQLERQAGSLALASLSRIAVPEGDTEAAETAAYFAARMKTAFGLDLAITTEPPLEARPVLTLHPSRRTDLGREGYELTITPASIEIGAAGRAGYFYGLQSVLQLLPVEAYGHSGAAAGPAVLPCVRIVDRPRLPWRGMLLDCSRHFFPLDFIKQFIDDLAVHKMNTFHWHLTDDQGWRLEIKKYPKLTEIGAWRVDREDKNWSSRPAQQAGEKATYGGFYTQDDVREVLAYAKTRCITVVPEIEMPGHCLSALASYPEFSCSGGPFTVPPGGVWPIKDVYCPGNDATFAFLEDILTEVTDLFPGEYIHIGGDEVDKSTWKTCPKCQARIKAEGLKSEEELQSWFIRRIEKFLNGRGKKLMGWDEILEGGLAPNAAVMSWRGIDGGIAAARAGHDVVMTPTSHCYFDYYQGDPTLEPPAIGGYLPLSKVYSYEPVPDALSAEETPFIIGAQANLWTEFVPTPAHAEYMTFPRIAAIAETAWTAREGKNWDDFLGRMVKQFRRYDQLGVHYARSIYAVKINPQADADSGRLKVRLATESYQPQIFYTLDGTEPGPAAIPYLAPFLLKGSAVIKAGVFAEGRLQGPISETKYLVHLALGRPVALQAPYSAKYDGGGPLALVDGLRGGPNHSDGRWQGFEGDDLVAVVDLGQAQAIRAVTIGFLQKLESWAFFPKSVEVALSDDGVDYRPLPAVSGIETTRDPGAQLKDIRIDAAGAKSRFVRITARSIGLCPDWHSGAGQKAWLFADEIIVY